MKKRLAKVWGTWYTKKVLRREQEKTSLKASKHHKEVECDEKEFKKSS